MEITLRKAAALQNTINETLKGIDFGVTVTVNEFQEPETEIANQLKNFQANLVRRAALTKALYELRKKIGRANNDAGIDDRLADVAHLEKELQFYNQIAGNNVRIDPKVLIGKLEKIRNRKEDNIYGRGDEVTTTILAKKDIDDFRKLAGQAKKNKQKLQDEILELNVRTTILLDEETARILEDEGMF